MNIFHQELLNELETQSTLYQPSVFWKEASKLMIEELSEKGVAHFRNLPSALNFFVPTYGYPGNALPEETMHSLKKFVESHGLSLKQQNYLNAFLSGYSAALADYRVLCASEHANNKSPDLLKFSESEIGSPIEHFDIEGKQYSRSSLNYLLGLSFLKKYADLEEIGSILEIGGGFGTLGEIIYQTMPNTSYINIDIPPTIFCSEYYLKNIVMQENFSEYSQLKDNDEIFIDQLKKITVLPSWKIEALRGKIDLFVNFISFQEMEPEIVKNYLDNIDRLKAKWILLRNMREGKQLRSQHRFGVDKPIFSEDYEHMLPNYQLVTKNVIPFGFKTADGFHSEIMLFKSKEV